MPVDRKQLIEDLNKAQEDYTSSVNNYWSNKSSENLEKMQDASRRLVTCVEAFYPEDKENENLVRFKIKIGQAAMKLEHGTDRHIASIAQHAVSDAIEQIKED